MRAINDEDDYKKAGNYWRWLKKKLNTEGVQLVSVTHDFKFQAPDGKQRFTDALGADCVQTLAKNYPNNRARNFLEWFTYSDNLIDTIIQLPSNLFFGASIATCIIVLKKNKADNRVCFIDASQEFIHEGNKNKLSEANQKRIYEAHMAKEEVAHFCHVVTTQDIEAEDFNLSVSTYVEQEDTREAVNIEELNKEIDEIVKRQSALRSQLDAIIKELETT